MELVDSCFSSTNRRTSVLALVRAEIVRTWLLLLLLLGVFVGWRGFGLRSVSGCFLFWLLRGVGGLLVWFFTLSERVGDVHFLAADLRMSFERIGTIGLAFEVNESELDGLLRWAHFTLLHLDGLGFRIESFQFGNADAFFD